MRLIIFSNFATTLRNIPNRTISRNAFRCQRIDLFSSILLAIVLNCNSNIYWHYSFIYIYQTIVICIIPSEPALLTSHIYYLFVLNQFDKSVIIIARSRFQSRLNDPFNFQYRTEFYSLRQLTALDWYHYYILLVSSRHSHL